MKTLTPEQAVIVSAFTGYHIGDFGQMHKAVEEKLGRPVFTHEFPAIREEIREAFRDDFIAMNPSANVKGDPRPSEDQASLPPETPDTLLNSDGGKSSGPPSC